MRCWYRGIEFQVDTCWIGFEIPQQVMSERASKTPAWSHGLECEVCKAGPWLPGSPCGPPPSEKRRNWDWSPPLVAAQSRAGMTLAKSRL